MGPRGLKETGLALATAAAATFIAACDNGGPKPTHTDTPARPTIARTIETPFATPNLSATVSVTATEATPQPHILGAQEALATADPLAVINYIEQKGLDPKSYSERPGINPTEELKQATSRYFCSQLDCKGKTPKQTADSVVISDATTFARSIAAEKSREVGRPLTQIESNNLMATSIGTDSGRTFINKDVVLETAQRIDRAQINGKDPQATLLRDLIEKAMVYNNLTNEQVNIGANAINYISERNINYTLDAVQMNGFSFEGNAQGEHIILRELQDVVVAYISTTLAEQQKEVPMSMSETDVNLAALLEQMNLSAKIPFNDFYKYATGELPFSDYLQHLADSFHDSRTGLVLKFYAMTVASSGSVDSNVVIAAIRQQYKLPVPSQQ